MERYREIKIKHLEIDVIIRKIGEFIANNVG